MSVKPEDRVLMKRNANPAEGEANEGVNCNSNSKADYYNLNIATFTFGGRGNPGLPLHSIEKEEISQHNNMPLQVNNYRKYNSVKKFSTATGSASDNTKENKVSIDTSCSSNFSLSTIINKIGSHNSFLSVIVHSLWHLKHFRNFILNEISVNEKESKYRLLFELQSVMNKYSQNKKIDVGKLRTSLAEAFGNRRKFLLDQPEDPVDCLFVFLNAVHSYTMVF
jgi:hypothetical protein